MTKEQTLPKWFDGTIYDEGGTVANRFTGEEIELNNIELSMYDFVMGVTMVIEMGKYNDKLLSMHRKGLQWFRIHSPTAYMVLLD